MLDLFSWIDYAAVYVNGAEALDLQFGFLRIHQK